MMLSTNGKVILLGEHAVVYGRPALAMSFSPGLTLVSQEEGEGALRVIVPAWQLEQSEADFTPVGEALRLARKLLPFCGGLTLSIDAHIPIGAGLGSSASLGLLVVRALARQGGHRLSRAQEREYTHEIEKVFHRDPSGLDDTVITFGGLCLFCRSGWNERPSAWESLEAITPQALRVPCALPTFVIADSRVPHSTQAMVAGLRHRYQLDPPWVEARIEAISRCVERAVAALDLADHAVLASAMQENHRLLVDLELSHPILEQMISVAMASGALAAKLTGGGGGGCIIALVSGDGAPIVGALNDAGYRAWLVNPQQAIY
ncbi:MAG: mevalonate kinase [Bradymonadales bacterium]|nr:mevalonate kinase [Bradymonadales bacterium]